MNKENECEFCNDEIGKMHLACRCHLTAPLQASIEDDVLTLRCYLPGCMKVVARFKVAARISAHPRSMKELSDSFYLNLGRITGYIMRQDESLEQEEAMACIQSIVNELEIYPKEEDESNNEKNEKA